jgi:hypothetical protein
MLCCVPQATLEGPPPGGGVLGGGAGGGAKGTGRVEGHNRALHVPLPGRQTVEALHCRSQDH